MESKTKKAILLFSEGNFKESLKIFRTFRIGFTKEEKRTIQIASESLSGNSAFYLQLGIDYKEEIEKSKLIIARKYLNIK